MRTNAAVDLLLLTAMALGCGRDPLLRGDAGSNGSAPAADSSADLPDPQKLCFATGGHLQPTLCCQGLNDFPSTCSPAGCRCANQSDTTVLTCNCPPDTCFTREAGCRGPNTPCTPGQDQTCNDNPAQSDISGVCTAQRTCVCGAGSSLNPATGKCR